MALGNFIFSLKKKKQFFVFSCAGFAIFWLRGGGHLFFPPPKPRFFYFNRALNRKAHFFFEGGCFSQFFFFHFLFWEKGFFTRGKGGGGRGEFFGFVSPIFIFFLQRVSPPIKNQLGTRFPGLGDPILF